MNALIDVAINRSKAFILILFIILIAGSSTYLSIPKEDSPDVQIPYIYVSMTHEGISPEDAERLLVRPMEKELQSIDGLKEIKATASEGFASVFMEFEAGFDSDEAILDVREKVDIAKSELPEETEEPIVKEVNLSLFPVVSIILTSNMQEAAFLRIAKSLADEIEGISEVLSVDIAGERLESLDIIIDPEKIESYGLTTQIIQLVKSNNKLIAAGALDAQSGRYNVKVPGLLETAKDLKNLAIKVHGDSVITLGDIAQIRRTFKDRGAFARVNGQSALVLEVSKRTGENLIETVKKVKEIVNKKSTQWPEAINILYAQDQSSKIIDMVNELQNNIFFAVLLVMIIIILFIGIRSAFFISLAIPGAFLMAILILSSLGVTLNIVVLFALILSIGMLVDNAIIVTEYANRKMIEGEPYTTAYGSAAKRMAWPIIASTITTLIVFAPLLYWPGIMGQFMKYLPMTLIATLSSSLAMALIFIPALGSRLGRADISSQKTKDNIHNSLKGNLLKITGLSGYYIRLLTLSIKHPIKSVLCIFLLIITITTSYVTLNAGVEFFPQVEPQNASVIIRARGNLSTIEKNEISQLVENRIFNMQDQIKIFYTRVGQIGENKSQYPDDVIAVIQLEYHEWDQRNKSEHILQEIKDRTKDIAGIIIETREQKGGPPSLRDIEIEISAHDRKLLAPIAKKILQEMHKITGLQDISSSLPIPAIEWQMEIDRAQAAKFNIDINMIGNFIKLVTNGIKATSYRPDDSDDEVDVMVRYPEKHRNLNQLDRLKVTNNEGSFPISSFVKRNAAPKISDIKKVNNLQVITIDADVNKDFIANNKITEIKEWLENASPSPHVNIRFKGDDERQQETQTFLKNAFIFAITAMFILLLLQFNSIWQAVIILSAVFLSIAGVLLGLLLTHSPFGIVMCGVGIISLAGIVVNNNIIFIDSFNKLRAQKMDINQAILRTAAQRMRPILLTAGTTVLGLIPMITAMNIDFIDRSVTFGAPSTQWWQQLSISIAGGLSFATILTLFFTPCLLIIGHKFFSKDR